jgi:predicted CopG family antitoxin
VTRKTLKIHPETYEALEDAKRDDETWDECLSRLAQLDRATRFEK